MFYDIKNKSLKYDDIFLQDIKIQTEEGEFDAQQTYFLNACDDTLLKELGFAKVKEEQIPSFDEETQELEPTQSYDELNNLYILSYEIRQKDLEKLKEQKLEKLKELKEEKLQFMPFKNTIFQIDTEAKINISGKISEIILKQSLANANSSGQNALATTGNDDAFFWLDKDNQKITFTQQEFLAFGISIAKYCEAVIFKHDELRKRALNASSLQDLQSIEWSE